jgi:uncharacterized glyoxalase superfamily protein PhnB
MVPTLDMIGIVVQDMTSALAFYRRLGLDIPGSADAEDHVEITLPGGIRVAWDEAEMTKSFDPQWQPPTGGPPIALAFLCANPGEVDRVYEDMISAGYQSHLPPWDAFWGQRYASLRDPDGNAVQLFAALETAAA